MGGVNDIDSLVSCCAIHTRTKKWYCCLYDLNVQMMEAWLMYRKFGSIFGMKSKEKILLLDFIRSGMEMRVLYHEKSLMRRMIPTIQAPELILAAVV